VSLGDFYKCGVRFAENTFIRPKRRRIRRENESNKAFVLIESKFLKRIDEGQSQPYLKEMNICSPQESAAIKIFNFYLK